MRVWCSEIFEVKGWYIVFHTFDFLQNGVGQDRLSQRLQGLGTFRNKIQEIRTFIALNIISIDASRFIKHLLIVHIRCQLKFVGLALSWVREVFVGSNDGEVFVALLSARVFKRQPHVLFGAHFAQAATHLNRTTDIQNSFARRTSLEFLWLLICLVK